MQVISPDLIKGKKVLLRLDIDVSLSDVSLQSSAVRQVIDDFRLKAGLKTLGMCLENAEETIILGHIGRPDGEDKSLSVEPIYDWLEEKGFGEELALGNLRILENLRFEKGEDEADLDYAKELAALGDVYINEAFAAYHKAASTTILPTLFPDVVDPEGRLRSRRAAGLHFAEEVQKLKRIRENPNRPLIAIVGGAKVEDKLPAVLALSKIADAVLVGGKIAAEIKNAPPNVFVAELNEEGTDVSAKSMVDWVKMIMNAKTIIWNGPMGKIEPGKLKVYEASERKFLGTARGTYEIAKLITESNAESIVGGGDTISALNDLMMVERFSFVSTGGGAMLEYIIKGTLPTVEALN